jgi:hypothetical protein
LHYNYVQNKITLNFEKFIKTIELEDSKNNDIINNQETYAQVLQILNGIESYLRVVISIK